MQKALSAFQQQQGLKVTGHADPKTLKILQKAVEEKSQAAKGQGGMATTSQKESNLADRRKEANIGSIAMQAKIQAQVGTRRSPGSGPVPAEYLSPAQDDVRTISSESMKEVGEYISPPRDDLKISNLSNPAEYISPATDDLKPISTTNLLQKGLDTRQVNKDGVPRAAQNRSETE
jgi:hypothetical protein